MLNNKFFLYFIMIIIFSSSVFSASWFFSPDSPPPTPGYICAPTGCLVVGNINGGNNTIYNITLEGVILKNVTFQQVFYVNATEIINEYWVNESGDTMSGTLNMDGNDIININVITSDDWSNVSITASQIIDYFEWGFNESDFINNSGVISLDYSNLDNRYVNEGDDHDTKYSNGIGLLLSGNVFYLNLDYLNNNYVNLSNFNWDNLSDKPAYTHLSNFTNDVGYVTELDACSNSTDFACLNKVNNFNRTIRINNGSVLEFTNSSHYFKFNHINSTLELWVNGEIQQDWGQSTTIYQKATFLADAIFQNLSGEEVIFNGNLRVTGYMKTDGVFVGSGANLTDVCLSTGIGCLPFNETFNSSLVLIDWNSLFNVPLGFADNIDNNTQYTHLSNFTNDQGFITEVNDTWYLDTKWNTTGKYLYNDSTTIYLNETKLNQTIDNRIVVGTDTHIQADNNYLYDNYTTMFFNESKLNNTIQQLTGIFEENVTITISSGIGTSATTDCCSGANEILQLAVFPTTPTNKYRFYANTTIGGEVVESDRALHEGNWLIAHRGSIVIDDTISYYLSSVQTDENFIIRVRYQK